MAAVKRNAASRVAAAQLSVLVMSTQVLGCFGEVSCPSQGAQQCDYVARFGLSVVTLCMGVELVLVVAVEDVLLGTQISDLVASLDSAHIVAVRNVMASLRAILELDVESRTCVAY